MGKADSRCGGLSHSHSIPGLLLCVLALQLCLQDSLATTGELCMPRGNLGACGEWGKAVWCTMDFVLSRLCSGGQSCRTGEEPFLMVQPP